MDDVLIAELLEIYTPPQIRRLIERSREVCLHGHGDVIITMSNHHPRYISKRISEDFLTCEGHKEVESAAKAE